MTRRTSRRQTIKRRGLGVLRCALAFVLTFQAVFACQCLAWGADGTDNIADTTASDVPSEPVATEPEPTLSTPSTPSTPSFTVDGITLYFETPYVNSGWQMCANSWEATPSTHGKLTSKGQTLAFKVQLVWSDGSTSWAEGASHPVAYSTSDTAVASVDSTGTVRALSNGSVRLTATCEGQSVSYVLDVTGQENECYVSEIAIVGLDGTVYGESGAGIELGDLNETALLNARVTVVDPATGTTQDYFTENGQLSFQTGGAISDITWSVSDTQLGYVEPSTGLYRPSEYATVLVSASSSAGLGGEVVSGSVWVMTSSPNKQPAGRNPQDHLTVKVFYEQAPDRIVREETFSRAEVEAMGTEMHTYTAIGSGSSFATASGRGVLFSRVLEAAGANLDGIAYFSFVTADSGSSTYGETVSYNMLFGTTRYYFPNWDVGKNPSGGIVVPPMLAVESNWRWYDSNVRDTSEDYSTMTDDTCFRLLFGATTSGQTTTNKQIYWINTINVVLSGAPPTEFGANGDGDGSGAGGQGGSGSESGAAQSGSGNTDSTVSGVESGLGHDQIGGVAAAEGEQSNTEEASGDAGKWSVYQIMNRNASDVDSLDEDNPWLPFVLPLTCGVAAAGAASKCAGYKRQKCSLKSA